MKKQDIKELMKFFSETENISKMKLKQDEIEIELEKDTSNTQQIFQAQPQAIAPTPIVYESANVQLDTPQNNSTTPCITSPMVGTFYQAPAPGAKPFTKVGDIVSKGQTVAIIEAMKIMNEIEAEYDCKIVKILVEDGQPVEYDMPLYEVEKL